MARHTAWRASGFNMFIDGTAVLEVSVREAEFAALGSALVKTSRAALRNTWGMQGFFSPLHRSHPLQYTLAADSSQRTVSPNFSA